MGLIAGIVVIAVLVIVVIVDLTCYCTNNAGLTAAVLGKRGVKDKDKEAMLEDGKNARLVTPTNSHVRFLRLPIFYDKLSRIFFYM